MLISLASLAFQCDMYSLGIILFEMCQLFKTDMERLKTIEKLRRGSSPESFTRHWTQQVGGLHDSMHSTRWLGVYRQQS